MQHREVKNLNKRIKMFNKLKGRTSFHLIGVFLMTNFLLLISCDNQERGQQHLKKIVIDKEAIIEGIRLSQIIEIKDIVPLETNQECLIVFIDKVLFFKNRWYVLDSNGSNSLLMFSEDGRYERKIGRVGKGPGEFNQPTDFSIDYENNTIVVLCASGRKVLKYNIDGDYISEFSIPFAAQNIESFAHSFVYNAQDQYRLYVTDKDGETNFHRFSNEFAIPVMTPMTTSNDQVLWTTFLNDTIYTIDTDGIQPKYHIDFGDNALTRKDYLNSDRLSTGTSNRRIIDKEKMSPIYWLSDSENFFRFSFNYIQGGILSIYNKKTEKTRLLAMKDIEDDIFHRSFMPMPNKRDKNYFTGIVLPGLQKGELPIIVNDKSYTFNKDDNPILVTYQYKSW